MKVLTAQWWIILNKAFLPSEMQLSHSELKTHKPNVFLETKK